ncbi:RNA dependent RNA polymerase-domain-containing protein [Mycena galericulata]|nr:RNA dependent RNA polymerase-domain-containing protein [Mycena galericulata]
MSSAGSDSEFWEAVDKIVEAATQPSSPVKAWRSPVKLNTPSTPSNGRVGLKPPAEQSPATPSRPQARAGTSASPSESTRIARTLGDVTIEDSELPPPKRLFSEELGLGSSAMKPPATIPAPRPLQASSTQTSFGSSASSNSLFSTVSAASSMSSLGSPSTLKRGPDDRHMASPSPSKSRKLSPQSGSFSADMSSPTTSSFSLLELFGGTHGSALALHTIAHDPQVQRQFDNVGVRFGVQWELARGVSMNRWNWRAVEKKMKDKYDAFTGFNSILASQVPAIMAGVRNPESRDLALWKEADREHDAITQGTSRGLGLAGPPEEPDYYGGQIQYPLRLVKADENLGEKYRIYLEKPQKGRSHRFGRDLGSSSVLQLSIPLNLVRDEGDDVRNFLAKRFVLNGRVYVPIPPKDKSSVYLIQINQDVNRKPSKFYGDQHRLSFEQFLQRHNPPNLNAKQPFAKYTARYALGLSTSIPVLEFEKKNIGDMRDILAEGWDSLQKPPSEKIMTDGCGFINRSALLAITKRVPYNNLPTAVQGRIGGAKGLWVLHPTDEDEEPKIWIRDSQRKIILEGDERVHRIFDLLRASHPPQTETRYHLSEQSIMCLSANGIPDGVLVDLLNTGLEETVKPLLDWDGSSSMVALWRAVNSSGNVSGSRKQRIAGAKSRVLGFADREREEVVDEEGGEADTPDSMATSSRSGRDVGGGPSSLQEQAIELIQAGFHPRTSMYLNDKMRYIIKNEIKSVVEKYKISLPESTASDAFVIPDPLGVLRENEIYYRTSNPMKDPVTETFFQVLSGKVILGRYPIRLPCDMQMVTAVDIPALAKWPDVIIASTAGQQSLLSLLSGGDYDGDTVFFTWVEPFLKHFKNQPFTPPPTDLISKYFERDVKTVEEVGCELRSLESAERQHAFQRYLLAGLQESQVGLYSWFHDNAIWKHGYNHEKSILMAYIGNTLLDAGKTGLSLKPGVFDEHMREFGHKRPKNDDWRGRRDDPSKPFVLQSLSIAGQEKGDELLHRHDTASGKLSPGYKGFEKDAVLLKPYRDAQKKSAMSEPWAASYKSELEKIKGHVNTVHDLWRSLQREEKKDRPEDKAKRAAALFSLKTKFAERIPDINLMDADEVKASYAYYLSPKEDFGFSVAFKTLCIIKARAMAGGIAPACRVFDELKTISGAASRAMQDVDEY